MMEQRGLSIIHDLPNLAAELDGRVWNVVYDGAPACDVRGDVCGYAVVCRLPADHDGLHIWLMPEVAQSGIRFF